MPIAIKVETTSLEPFEPEARIVSIGLLDIASGESRVITDPDEHAILTQFWEDVGKDRIVGFNFEFDHRWLVLRSLKHGIPVKQLVVTDLRTALGLGHRGVRGKLEEFAELIGERKDAFHGRDVPILWKLGKKEELIAYNKADVELIAKLYARMKKIGLVG